MTVRVQVRFPLFDGGARKGRVLSASAQEVQAEYNLPCISIAGLDDLLQFLETSQSPGVDIDAIPRYRERYGIQD